MAVARAAAMMLGGGAAAVVMLHAQDVALASETSRPAVTVSGGASGIVAGGPAQPLVVTLRNAGATPVRISSVTATPEGTARCAATYLRLTSWHGSLVVPARGFATVTLRVRLDGRVPAACATRSWTLGYAAR